MKIGSKFYLCSLVILTVNFAIAQNFDINAYKQFLAAHQNLTTTQLLQMYNAGAFNPKAYSFPPNTLYLDTIISRLQLTQYELSLINKHGFMVTERLKKSSFGHAFLDIWHKDLPVFISTDAILHTMHMSYDKILMDVELQILIPKLQELLTKLHSRMSVLASQYPTAEMKPMLKDVDVYLTVARRFFLPAVLPYFAENQIVVNEIMNLIQLEKPAQYPLFASVNRKIDFSQFKLRGHYTNTQYPDLAKYFKSMIWLGRTEIYLLPPRSSDLPPAPEDIKRQTIDAVLILEAAKLSNALPILDEIDSIIKFFVGESDNVTLPNIHELVTSANIISADQLLDSITLQKFQDTLKTKSYAFQRILSQILYSDPMCPDSIIPASAFLLLGQRFIVDSYVFSQVVYDRIKSNNEKIRRMLPLSLDVLFALGNDASAQLLKPELDRYKYGTNLAALRYLIDSYGTDFWNVSLYNLWLNSIRALNPPSSRDGLPPFMKTAAWWQEKMNTQLSSWAQLRHDNLLYAKQSYTGGVICSFPFGYVEPIPKFYSAVKTYAQIAEEKFQSINFPNPYIKSSIVKYYGFLKNIADTLYSISQKELNGTLLSNAEKEFLRKVIFEQQVCGIQYDGWYVRLFYTRMGEVDALKTDLVVADVHTSPTDAKGNTVGWIYHVGTGYVNLGVFVAQIPEGQIIAFVGPVMSYHEYITSNFLRLSDEEWKATYLFNSTRPSFVNLYLADSSGNSRGEGTNLITGYESAPTPVFPQTFKLEQNYPNPFNSTTLIGFSIQQNLANSLVELNVYNIQGLLIKKLLSQELPAGNYIVNWNGTNEKNLSMPSGIYLYELKCGEKKLSRKMILMK